MASVTTRQLFGGGISCEIPTEFRDVSEMRQVWVWDRRCCSIVASFSSPSLLTLYLIIVIIKARQSRSLFTPKSRARSKCSRSMSHYRTLGISKASFQSRCGSVLFQRLGRCKWCCKRQHDISLSILVSDAKHFESIGTILWHWNAKCFSRTWQRCCRESTSQPSSVDNGWNLCFETRECWNGLARYAFDSNDKRRQ